MTNHPTQSLIDPEAGKVAAALPADLVGDDAGLVEPITIERNIRVALWNTGCWQGKPQEVAQSFIRHAMEEPTMVRALASIQSQFTKITELSARVALLEVMATQDRAAMEAVGKLNIGYMQRASAAEARVAQLEAIAAKLAGYAGHADVCTIGKLGCEDQCFCGLTQALTEYKDRVCPMIS